MEPLWSQAGATGGNRPQAHLPVAEVVMNPESIDDRQFAMYAAATGRAAAGRVPGGRVGRPVRLASFNPEPTLPGGKEHPASAQEGAQPRGAGARGAAGERHTGGDGRFSESARWPAGGEPRSDLVSFFVRVIVTVSVTNQEYGRERSRSRNLLITEDL